MRTNHELLEARTSFWGKCWNHKLVWSLALPSPKLSRVYSSYMYIKSLYKFTYIYLRMDDDFSVKENLFYNCNAWRIVLKQFILPLSECYFIDYSWQMMWFLILHEEWLFLRRLSCLMKTVYWALRMYYRKSRYIKQNNRIFKHNLGYLQRI